MSAAFKVSGIFLMLLICPLITLILMAHLWAYVIVILIGTGALLAIRGLVRMAGKLQKSSSAAR